MNLGTAVSGTSKLIYLFVPPSASLGSGKLAASASAAEDP